MAQMQAAPAADPSVLAAIAALFGGQQPQATPSSPVLDGLPAAIRQMQVGPQADPSTVAASPMPAGGPAPGPAPMAAPPPQMAPAPSAGPPAGAPMLNAPSGPPGGAPLLPPPPMIQPTNHIGDVLDSITGGHFAYARRQEYGQQMANYQNAKMQAIAQSISDPVARRLFLADPASWAKAQETQQEAANVDGGNSRYIPDMGFVTAPKVGIDDKSGLPYTQTPGGIVTGTSLGGDVSAHDGLIVSGRTGVGGTYSQPQILAPGATPSTFTPAVNGSGPPAGAPLVGGGTVGPAPGAGGTVGANILARPSVSALSPADQATLLATGMTESGLNPNSPSNGSSVGMFQFHPKTFATLGGTNINDPGQQTDAAVALQQQNKAALQGALQRAPTPAELYIAHQQGLGGAKALLTAPPNTGAVAALTGAGVDPTRAMQSIAGNIGMPYKTPAQRAAANAAAQSMTTGQFSDLWTRKFGERLSAVTGGAQGGVAAAPGGAAPASNGFSVGSPVGGLRDVPPAEAIAKGLAPGRWQVGPTGKYELASPAPKDDLARVDSLSATASTLHDLVNEQTAWMQHNAKVNSGLMYSDPEVHGIGLNPVLDYQETHDPNVKALSASQGKQLFLVKPSNAGARILQSELPYWKLQTQSLAATPAVNQGVLADNTQKLQVAQAQANFYRNYVYQNGNLNGADQAWQAQQRGGRGQPSAQPARAAPPQPGSVVKGFKFLGGDPSQRSSWAPAR